MRIAIITQYYAPEAIRIPQTLANQLTARGHSVRVITGYPNYPDGEIFPGYKQRWNHVETTNGVEVRRVPLFISHSYNPIARFANYLSFAASVALWGLWVRSADVVYVYATQMTPAIGPSIWRILFRIPYVMHIQDLWPESVTGSSMAGKKTSRKLISVILRPWLRSLYKTSAATIAIAPSMVKILIARSVPKDRIHMVFNWATSEPRSITQLVGPSDTVSIVYAGNLGDHQDLDTVIRAANAVKSLKNLQVCIVGSGVAETRIRALARELDAHNVVFKGRVAPEDMAKIHAESDFQLVTLKNAEIFDGTIPSKLQASLSHGIPVITSVRGDVKSLVRENGLGFTCDPEDVDQLASAMSKAAALSPSDRVAMGEAARIFYMSAMSMDRGVTKIEEILSSVSRHSRTKIEWS